MYIYSFSFLDDTRLLFMIMVVRITSKHIFGELIDCVKMCKSDANFIVIIIYNE